MDEPSIQTIVVKPLIHGYSTKNTQLINIDSK